MRTGDFAGRSDALRLRIDALRQGDRRRASRRAFLGLATGTAIGAAGGHWLPRQGDAAAAESPLPELDWAREIARAPLDQLCARQVQFVTTVGQARRVDEAVWLGVVRLANALVERHPATRRGLRTALLLLRRRSDLPPHVVLWLDFLEAQPR